MHIVPTERPSRENNITRDQLPIPEIPSTPRRMSRKMNDVERCRTIRDLVTVLDDLIHFALREVCSALLSYIRSTLSSCIESVDRPHQRPVGAQMRWEHQCREAARELNQQLKKHGLTSLFAFQATLTKGLRYA